MVERFRLDAVQTRRFLGELARGTRKLPVWVAASPAGLRIDRRPSAGSVPVDGLDRLHLLAGHAPHAGSLRVFEDPAGLGGEVGTCWELDIGDGRLTIVLSPARNRGFSGEGGVLAALADRSAWADAEKVSEALTSTRALGTADAALQAGLTAERAHKALVVLGARGTAAYDAGAARWFRRDLPFDADESVRLHPRLREAHRLVETGAVRHTVATTGESGRAEEAFSFCRLFIRAGLCPRPDGDAYILCMAHALSTLPFTYRSRWYGRSSSDPIDPQVEPEQAEYGRARRARTLRTALLDDPDLLAWEVWQLFLVPGRRSRMLAPPLKDRRTKKSDHLWDSVLADLSAEGYLDRARLLDEALSAAARPFPPSQIGWYLALHDRLDPTAAERAERAGAYLHLLNAPDAGAVRFAVENIRRLEAGDEFAELSRAK